ncbi:hypothetical protein [Paenibacillus rhizoplanae]|uniref:hypothetical protein n=1 Tax=Paenibacillus rhizoplanae TaxID=1917181 RepID=UPI003620699A
MKILATSITIITLLIVMITSMFTSSSISADPSSPSAPTQNIYNTAGLLSGKDLFYVPNVHLSAGKPYLNLTDKIAASNLDTKAGYAYYRDLGALYDIESFALDLTYYGTWGWSVAFYDQNRNTISTIENPLKDGSIIHLPTIVKCTLCKTNQL